MSSKLKITLWITAMMLIMAVIVVAFVIVVENASIADDPTDALVGIVMENSTKIEYSDGTFSWNKLDFYSRGVYCSFFTADGTELVGAFPTSERFVLDFKSGVIRSVTIGEDDFYVFDLFVDLETGGVWVRGIMSAANNSTVISSIITLTYTLLPILLVFSIGGGWLIAYQAFTPVELIADSADSIGSGSDLSARINLTRGPTEMKRIAGSFDRMFARLEESFDSEKKFTSAASHELRTPITVILAECDRAKRKCETREDFLDSIEAIEDQGERMSVLVHQLLSLSRLQYRASGYQMRVSPLSEFIDACVDEFVPKERRSIALARNISPNIYAKYNPELLTRVIENLLQNAYKYGRDNGHIFISLEEDDEGGCAVLSVKDDGIGIAEEDIDNIWRRFWQADPSRGISAGAGLGLALVKEIIDMHGGRVFVRSVLGEGSEFIVTLPNS